MCNFEQFLAIVLVNVLSTGIEIQIIDYFYKNLASLHHVLLCKEIAYEVFFFFEFYFSAWSRHLYKKYLING